MLSPADGGARLHRDVEGGIVEGGDRRFFHHALKREGRLVDTPMSHTMSSRRLTRVGQSFC
jgi:hypothetical protein